MPVDDPGRRLRLLLSLVVIGAALAGCSASPRTGPRATAAPSPGFSAPTGNTINPGTSVTSSTVGTAPAPTGASAPTESTSGTPDPTSTEPAATSLTVTTSAGRPVPSAPGVPALPLPDCQASQLHTVEPGVLTVGTGTVPDPPWFVSDDPSNGRGLDAAVIAEVAAVLGFRPGKVAWRTGVDPADLTGGSIDLLVGRAQIPDQPGADWVWSTGYYDLGTAMVARAGTEAAAATSTTALAALLIGAVSGGDAEAAVRAAIPGARITSYPNVAAARQALSVGDVDALALPTWRAVAEARADSAITVLGTLPTAGMQPRQLGIVLAAGSSLTACVSAALDAMRAQGDLVSLAATWIGDVPALT